MNRLNILATANMLLVSSLFIFLGTSSYVLAESSISNSTSTTTDNAPLSMSKMSNMTSENNNASLSMSKMSNTSTLSGNESSRS
jgi:hypothetical protein